MATRAHFSIALLMAIVFFVAADFAIVRAFWDGPGNAFAVAVTTLPMVNLLLLALPRLRRRDARPFWLGFEVVGWPVVLLAVFLGWFHQLLFYSLMFRIDRLDLFATNSELPYLVAIAVVLYTFPQLLAAAIGGWLSARYRVIIERRR